jgi:integrase/recombinase XerD
MTTPSPASPRGAARTPAKRKARELAKHLRAERPDYAYLKDVFRHLRAELDVEITRQPKTLPYVPTQDEIRRYHRTVWQGRRTGDVVLIMTLLYTGGRVAELVALRLDDVDLDANRVRVNLGKGGKDRLVPSRPRSPRPSPCTWTQCAAAATTLHGYGDLRNA